MTRILPAFSPEEIRAAAMEAAEVLRSGQPVALPSETVYGLAANALNAAACSEIFAAKNRPLDDPLIVHIADPTDLPRVAHAAILPRLEGLIREFWPGPLTLILPKNPAIPDIVTSGQNTVAVRCTAHPVFKAVLEAFGSPLAAPSANRFGRISPTEAAHVTEELGGRIPLIIDGGACRHGIESTIVSLADDFMEILRHGPVTAEMLAPFGKIREPSGMPATPGGLKSHYAPRTPLELVGSASEVPVEERATAALLAWESSPPEGFAAIEYLSRGGNLREGAARLYGAMRRLDAAGARRIYAEMPPMTGLGIAIIERLRKAAAHGEISA